MESFESLSTELLLKIVSYLDSPLDLASLSIQNRQLYCIIDPLLELMLRIVEIDGDCNFQYTQDVILALIDQPRLARYWPFHLFLLDNIIDPLKFKFQSCCWLWILSYVGYVRVVNTGHDCCPFDCWEDENESISRLNPWKESLFRKAIEAQKSVWSSSASPNLLLEVLKNSKLRDSGENSPNKYQFHDAAVTVLQPLLRQVSHQ